MIMITLSQFHHCHHIIMIVITLGQSDSIDHRQQGATRLPTARTL